MSDGLPALALTVEPAAQDTMDRPPYLPTEHLFSRGMGWDIIWIGLVTGLVSLGPGYTYWRMNPGSHWQTMLFTILTFSETPFTTQVVEEQKEKRVSIRMMLFASVKRSINLSARYGKLTQSGSRGWCQASTGVFQAYGRLGRDLH
jgi:magnesium-transporting ATPase (P-type)